ncbi:hypothetical protein JP75_20375 [Devosia riboflavina]|uniref:Uncharacterized protein n=1 Tax=Devosia riboflavina TaxID=46914 RepID=A0A087LY26_9HYPH|nr:hypothetical protein [Devosia riboflavina]KFL29529.1 hypothetical protein JP75_20375 [Devosia riboflavina]
MNPQFDDGRYTVTRSALSTPTGIYPLSHATVRRRRDLFWLSAAIGMLAGGALTVYADLLTDQERAVLVITPLALLAVSACVGVLSVDAPGHARTLVITTAGRSRKIFTAIAKSKLAESGHSAAHTATQEDFGK